MKSLREPPEQQGLVLTGAWLPFKRGYLFTWPPRGAALHGSPWEVSQLWHVPGDQARAAAAQPKWPPLCRSRPREVGQEPSSEHPQRESPMQAGEGPERGQAARGQCRVGIPAPVLPRGCHCALRRPSHMSPGESEEGSPCPGIPSALQLRKSEERSAAERGSFPLPGRLSTEGELVFSILSYCAQNTYREICPLNRCFSAQCIVFDYRYIVAHRISRAYSSCLTETLCPSISDSPYPFLTT